MEGWIDVYILEKETELWLKSGSKFWNERIKRGRQREKESESNIGTYS